MENNLEYKTIETNQEDMIRYLGFNVDISYKKNFRGYLQYDNLMKAYNKKHIQYDNLMKGYFISKGSHIGKYEPLK